MRRALVGVVMVCLAVLSPGAAFAGGGHEVFPPDSSPYGMTYPQWTAAYQKWGEEIPARKNPLVDPDSPLNCASQGKVVFIGSSGTGAGCTIAADEALVIATSFWECSTAEGLGDTYAELRQCAKDNFHHDLGHEALRVTLTIDGERLPHSREWTFLGPGQILDFPKNNIWGVPGGPTKSVTKGFLYIIAPLDEGEHLIVEHATFAGGGKIHVRFPVTVEA
jgi:hypothetical protein